MKSIQVALRQNAETIWFDGRQIDLVYNRSSLTGILE